MGGEGESEKSEWGERVELEKKVGREGEERAK